MRPVRFCLSCALAASSTSLAQLAPLPGDVNGDCAVGAGDLGIVLANWGTPGPGDVNGDGTVDQIDLDLVNANFGLVCARYFVGDVDGSGVVDFDDVLWLLGELSAGRLTADHNGDGRLDFFDLSAFVADFRDGV